MEKAVPFPFLYQERDSKSFKTVRIQKGIGKNVLICCLQEKIKSKAAF